MLVSKCYNNSMYKEFTAPEWRKLFKLPDDYSVSGILVYGAWDKPKQTSILEKHLADMGIEFQLNPLPDFLSGMSELVIDGKHYWFAVAYGGAILSEYVHLACMFGSRKNILIGSCGGLFEQMNSGDFILPTYVNGNESSTRLYQREVSDHKHMPDQALGDSLTNRIDAKYKIHRGPTITCQAMMGETLQDIKDWSAAGYFGVEMEAATVIAVSNHFKVPATALLVVGDNLIKGEAVGGEGYENARVFREEVRVQQYHAAILELLK